MEAAVFSCSICGDPSHEICAYCTKDACGIHLCDRCHRCSDCCVCDQPRVREEANGTVKENAETVVPEQPHARESTEEAVYDAPEV